MPNGIDVDTTVKIDWYTLGQHLAELSSLDQAAFLDGFSGGIHGQGAVDGGRQVLFMAEKVHGYTKWLVEELSEALA